MLLKRNDRARVIVLEDSDGTNADACILDPQISTIKTNKAAKVVRRLRFRAIMVGNCYGVLQF